MIECWKAEMASALRIASGIAPGSQRLYPSASPSTPIRRLSPRDPLSSSSSRSLRIRGSFCDNKAPVAASSGIPKQDGIQGGPDLLHALNFVVLYNPLTSASRRGNALRAVARDEAEVEEDASLNGSVSASTGTKTKELQRQASLSSSRKQEETGLLASSQAGIEKDEDELSWSDLVSPEVADEVSQRLQRLEVLMLVRRLYRDVARSERVIQIPTPRIARKKEGTQELKVRRRRRGGNEWMRRLLEGDVMLGGRFETDKEDIPPEPLEFDSASEVLEFAEDIRELAVSLKTDVARLHDRLPTLFPGDQEVATTVRSTVDMLETELDALAERIENSLTAEDRKNAAQEREKERQFQAEPVQTRILLRLEGLSNTGQVVLGQVVPERLAGVGQNLSQIDLASSFNNFKIFNDAKQAGSSAVQTLGDLWRRLNGLPAACDLEPLAAGLPRPSSSLSEEEEKKVALLLQLEALDKKLTEASRARETRLRQRNSPSRTRLLATEIRALDDEVNDVRKQLAVRALQLEMQLIYMALESELLLSGSASDIRTDEEEALLIAEFGLLDTDLARLRTAVDRQEAILIDDAELDVLAMDIPDLKQRLGIVEDPSVPLSQRLQLTAEEARGKVTEGSSFLWRGLRLLGGDIAYSFRLFWIAANGATLKPREVQTLRRTAKDILVIVPFTIILIVPITPVGHVLVFSFIQKYFPGFFPSSFSSRRQEVMKRYELLKMELESGSALTKMNREQAEAMAAAAAAETFEAREDDFSGAGIHGSPSSGIEAPRWNIPFFGRSTQLSPKEGEIYSSARVLENDPKKLRLLQEKLPGISSFLADLKARESRQGQAALLSQSQEGSSKEPKNGPPKS